MKLLVTYFVYFHSPFAQLVVSGKMSSSPEKSEVVFECVVGSQNVAQGR
jgi:hypothetical protein